MKTRPCRGCGKEIVWGIDPETGKSIPLDPRPPVYRIQEVGVDQISAVRDRQALVSHFATCPKASRFSGSRKKGGERSSVEKSPDTDVPPH